VLPSVDVVVSHAGLGTVTAALAHGVALGAIPSAATSTSTRSASRLSAPASR
jgi:hypothetical protein